MLKGIKKFLIDVFNVIYRILYGYAKWVLLFVILIVCAQVLVRNAFRSNIRWNQEVALLLTIWMAFSGIAIGVEKNLHIAVEMFYSWFPQPLQKAITKVVMFLELVVGVIFAYYGVRICISTSTSTLPVTKLPSTMMYIMIPISGICIVYFVLLDLLGLKKYKKTEDSHQKEAAKEEQL
ncbi:MAG: TRAP transporter small permease [Lachnospiraceae bacterium]|nr:TRAP transporter small permease [Lachnospiraceae bacterium]